MEKTESRKIEMEKNIYIYVHIYIYDCPPPPPPVIKKKERNGLPKVHGIVRTLLASILVSIVIFS